MLKWFVSKTYLICEGIYKFGVLKSGKNDHKAIFVYSLPFACDLIPVQVFKYDATHGGAPPKNCKQHARRRDGHRSD